MALFTPTQLEELRRLSAGMLDHVRRVMRHEDPPDREFGEMMSQLHVHFGVQGAAYAIRAWLDAVIDVSPTFGRGEINALALVNEHGTGFQDPRVLPADYRWAAAVMLARFSDDQVGLYRLIEQLPPYGAGLYLLRVLQMCADLLNAYDKPAPDRPIRLGEVITLPCTEAHHVH
jgi:hypothetical protein